MSLPSSGPADLGQRSYVLGVPIDVINMERVVESVVTWASGAGSRKVFVREVASLMAARDEQKLRDMHEEADLVVPDGMPLVWIGRMRGYGQKIGRVSGADLVDAVCARSLRSRQSHYFFGGMPGVAEAMASKLKERHPGLKVVGTFSPPMRQIGPNYELDTNALAEIEMIKLANPDFIWVGISSPKQEYWMAKAAPIVGRGVFFGVGAAFDYHSGRVRRAPKWMRDSGLEWLHRLLSEPQRLWYRYMVLAPRFVYLVIKDAMVQRDRGNPNRRSDG